MNSSTLLTLPLVSLCVGACSSAELDAPTPGAPPSLQRTSSALTLGVHPIGTEPPEPIQYNTGHYLSVASSGSDNNLLVFYDGGRIRGVRFDDTGTVLNLADWLRLGDNRDAADSQAYTTLAYGEGVYLAGFSNGSADATGYFVQAIDQDGTLLSEPQLVDERAGYGDLVFNGTDFTVAFYAGDVGLARVALDGTVVADSKRYVTTDSVTNRPQLAMGDGVGVVVFEQALDGAERRVFAARFTQEGEVLDPGGMQLSSATTSSVEVSIAAGDDQFVAVWGGPAGAVYGSLIDADGTVVDTEFPISRSPGSIGGSAVAFDGEHYAVVWEDDRDGDEALYGTRLDGNGAHVDAADTLIAAASNAYQSWQMDLHWVGDHYLLAYANDGIEGALLGPELDVLDPGRMELTPLPVSQYLSQVAFDGQAYVLGYSHEPETATYQFRSVRIDPAGKVLNPEGDWISDNAASQLVSGMNVASNGRTTLFGYSVIDDGRTTYLRSRAGDGELSPPLLLDWTNDEGLRLMSNGESYLGMFYAGANANGNTTEIWGQRLGEDGARDGEAFLIREMERPRAGIYNSGSGYLLAFSGQQIGGEPITGSVLSLAADGSEVADYGPVMDGTLYATAASNGQTSLFAWSVRDEPGLYGRRLDHEMGWDEPFLIADLGENYGSAVGWTGEEFVVVWPDSRAQLLACTVQEDGTLGDTVPVMDGDLISPTLTPGPDGQLLLSYLRYTEWSRSRRVESLLLGPGDGLDITEVDDDTEPEPAADVTNEPSAPDDNTADDDVDGSPEPTDDDVERDGNTTTTDDTDTITGENAGATADDLAGQAEGYDAVGDGTRAPVAGESSGGSRGGLCSLGAVGSHGTGPFMLAGLLLGTAALRRRRHG